uniref:Nodulin-like domain-containing protein n=1 Tax=Syphacia muris TaxID=451379 RepID=A0A0N5AMX0_9BILA
MNLLRSLSRMSAFELSCILQLGIGTMFMFVGLDTHSFILESVLHSVSSRAPSRINKYAGYSGQACLYITFAIANLFAPSLIRRYDPKWSVFIGSLFNTLYYIGFQYINSYYFYFSAVLLGIGSAVFYTGHGCYLTEHSREKHMARNASVSWAVACLSFTTGGLILIWAFNKNEVVEEDGYREFSDSLIRYIFGAFSIFCILSNVTFFFLRPKQPGIQTVERQPKVSFTKGIVATFNTFKKPNIWWLSLSWLYMGIYTGFMLGVFPTTLIFTQTLSSSSILISFYSFSVSLGELSIAFIISLFASHYPDFGRVPTAIIGAVIHIIVFVLVLFWTPRYSTLRPNSDNGLLFKPKFVLLAYFSFYVALLSGYCMGIADGCWNTVRCCVIPILLMNNRAEGFSISKAFQVI